LTVLPRIASCGTEECIAVRMYWVGRARMAMRQVEELADDVGLDLRPRSATCQQRQRREECRWSLKSGPLVAFES
jgi:hypothetical protein